MDSLLFLCVQLIAHNYIMVICLIWTQDNTFSLNLALYLYNSAFFFLRYIFSQTIKPVFLFAATIYQIFYRKVLPERAFSLPLGKLKWFQSIFHLSSQYFFWLLFS